VLQAALLAAPLGHACCHNGTGSLDLTYLPCTQRRCSEQAAVAKLSSASELCLLATSRLQQ
jgi:hypothetical protein